MLSLRIGLDVVRQKSDREARMLNAAPPGLLAFGRRLMAVAAAALPAMVAAASAVAQPELSGRRHATSAASWSADLRSATPSSDDSAGTMNVVAAEDSGGDGGVGDGGS